MINIGKGMLVSMVAMVGIAVGETSVFADSTSDNQSTTSELVKNIGDESKVIMSNDMEGVEIYDVPDDAFSRLSTTIVGGEDNIVSKDAGDRKFVIKLNITTTGGNLAGYVQYEYHYTIDSDYKDIHRRHVDGYYITRGDTYFNILGTAKAPLGIPDSKTSKKVSSTYPQINGSWTIDLVNDYKIIGVPISIATTLHIDSAIALKAGTHSVEEAFYVSHA